LTTLENKAFFKDGQQKQGLFAFDKSKLTTTKSGHLARYLIGGNMLTDDEVIRRAFDDEIIGNGSRQIDLLCKRVDALNREIDRLRDSLAQSMAEVERLKDVEYSLAAAEQQITEAHNVLGLCRDYSKELTKNVDRLIGPEDDV
jgi:hypothetical protein